MTEKETKILTDLVEKFGLYEDECFNEIQFLTEHKFHIQRDVVDIKRQAFHTCYRELKNVVEQLKSKQE